MVPFVEDEDDEDEKAEDESAKQVKDKKKVQPPKIAQELSDLVHLKATGFKGFEESTAKFKAWEMCSFSEKKNNKFTTKHLPDYMGFNCKLLARIYPGGMRVDSSNYDPVPAWVAGAQIVALNYQTGSEPTYLNDGKFLDNGRCGYVLKPKYMRTEKVFFDPMQKQKQNKTLFVEVISAYQLPKKHGAEDKSKGEVIDPYVKLKVRGANVDTTVKSQKTKVVKSNGFNPVWRAEFKFPIHFPDLALLFFEVADADMLSKDDFIGQYCLPVASIREGYRTVPLKDNRGKMYEKASLFVRFKWT